MGGRWRGIHYLVRDRGCIVFSMDELYYNKKSEEYVETLEEVEAYRINTIRDLKILWKPTWSYATGENHTSE